jgi:hypothetical protein
MAKWLRGRKGRIPVVKTKGRAQNMMLLDEKNDTQNSPGSLSSGEDKPVGYSIQVLDSTSATYLGRWRTMFRALGIQTLRSPLFFHVDPRDRDGLKEFAYANGREAEMVELKGVVGKEVSKHQLKKSRKRRHTNSEPRLVVLVET